MSATEEERIAAELEGIAAHAEDRRAAGVESNGDAPTELAGEPTREELIAAIVAELGEHPEKRDELLAEIFIEASSHRQMLETIAETMAELLQDPKRIVRAFFGSRRRRGRHERGAGSEDLLALVAVEEEEESP